MTFFPSGFDARADSVVKLDLVSIDTPDGEARFIIGQDGKFTDASENVWWGSSLISAGDLEMSIGGTAPSGAITLAYNIDDTVGAPSLIADLRALGRSYVSGRSVTFWLQLLQTVEQFHAPVLAPIPLAVRVATSLSFQIEGPQRRAISLGIEGPFANRNTARGYVYNTADHARLIGSDNPSLEFMPTDLYQRPDERVFG
jgi:hypothetical protein